MTTVTPADLIEAEICNRISKLKTVPAEEHERRRCEKRDKEHASTASMILETAELPFRQFSASKTLIYAGPWEQKRADIATKLGNGFLIALTGIRGNGKTQMAVEIARAAAEKELTVHYRTATTFFMDIKATYGKEAAMDEIDVIKSYEKPNLLILDELGNRSESDWENRLMHELINRRYADMTDTLLIDNRLPNDFKDAIGPSLTSRMNETGGIIHCDWPSFRI